MYFGAFSILVPILSIQSYPCSLLGLAIKSNLDLRLNIDGNLDLGLRLLINYRDNKIGKTGSVGIKV